VAYSLGLAMVGRLMDRIETRRGLTISVTWYSLVSILTSLATGFLTHATPNVEETNTKYELNCLFNCALP
jgi:MFS family permease